MKKNTNVNVGSMMCKLLSSSFFFADQIDLILLLSKTCIENGHFEPNALSFHMATVNVIFNGSREKNTLHGNTWYRLQIQGLDQNEDRISMSKTLYTPSIIMLFERRTFRPAFSI